MKPVGYAYLVGRLGLAVRPLALPAVVAGSVNRRVDTEDRILFPSGVALEDTPLGHLEFAIRHEGIDLATIAAALPRIGRDLIVARLRENPNGEYLRRIAFLWEWLTGAPLDAGVRPTARYVDLFDPRQYACARYPTRNPRYRVNNNALGDPRFCPIVHRAACPEPGWLDALLARAVDLTHASRAAGLYERALQYLYLSETKGSFAIEREAPSVHREERFIRILRQASSVPGLTEDLLVDLQNAIVRHDFAKEASYRTRQNWLENAAGRITFLPHPPETLRETMAGWEAFVNDATRGIDPLIKAACAAFGLVYIHPFMDGNGRLHRYVIHHVLARSGLAPPEMIIPVSAVIMKHIPRYHQVLTGFSEAVTRLWDYRRLDDGPEILSHPGAAPYRYPLADAEVRFLRDMLSLTVEQEIPQELAWLQAYDEAFHRIDREFDLPASDISRLIRMISGNEGHLAKGKRHQFANLPDELIARIEQVVRESLAASRTGCDGMA